jgi:hypothetical protein
VGLRTLDRRDEQQVRPSWLVGEDLDECLFGVCFDLKAP